MYSTSILEVQYIHIVQHNDNNEVVWCANKRIRPSDQLILPSVPASLLTSMVSSLENWMRNFLNELASANRGIIFRYVRLKFRPRCIWNINTSHTCIQFNEVHIPPYLFCERWKTQQFNKQNRGLRRPLEHGPLARYVLLRVAHAPGMPGMFSPPPRVYDPDMHHGTCVTQVPWCMPGSLTRGFLWSRWWGKRSRHSRCMRNLHFYVSGKRPMAQGIKNALLDPCRERCEYNEHDFKCYT